MTKKVTWLVVKMYQEVLEKEGGKLDMPEELYK